MKRAGQGCRRALTQQQNYFYIQPVSAPLCEEGQQTTGVHVLTKLSKTDYLRVA